MLWKSTGYLIFCRQARAFSPPPSYSLGSSWA